MADAIFDIAKGAFAEKIRDGAGNVGVMLLKTTQADATLKTYATVAALLAAGGGTANVEANFTNYARKTALTGTNVVDTVGHKVDSSVANQTWTNAGGATNNTLVKLVVYYEESAADSGRIPLSAHDYAVTTDGSDLTGQFPANGFAEAA